MPSTFDFSFIPPVIAHRGARLQAPENTLSAFEIACQQGASWIETDVKITHDGVPILMHDDMLDRTTNGSGPVADCSWEYIQTLDAGVKFSPSFANIRVPHLTLALRMLFSHYMRANLEIKPCPGRTQATTMIALMEAAKIWPTDYPPPLISSFDLEALAIAAQLHPDWPRGLLLEEWRDDWAAIAKSVKASTLNINDEALTPQRLDCMLASGLPVLVFTVNDPIHAKELLHSGVSAVFCDDPREIIRSL